MALTVFLASDSLHPSLLGLLGVSLLRWGLLGAGGFKDRTPRRLSHQGEG